MAVHPDLWGLFSINSLHSSHTTVSRQAGGTSMRHFAQEALDASYVSCRKSWHNLTRPT